MGPPLRLRLAALRYGARCSLGPARAAPAWSGLWPPLHIARPNGSPALRPSFDKNLRLVQAFFKGIAVAMAEKNNAE